MSVVLVKVKWNKQQFDDVELDLSGDVLQFKTQLYSLTGASVSLLNSIFESADVSSVRCACG